MELGREGAESADNLPQISFGGRALLHVQAELEGYPASGSK